MAEQLGVPVAAVVLSIRTEEADHEEAELVETQLQSEPDAGLAVEVVITLRTKTIQGGKEKVLEETKEKEHTLISSLLKPMKLPGVSDVVFTEPVVSEPLITTEELTVSSREAEALRASITPMPTETPTESPTETPTDTPTPAPTTAAPTTTPTSIPTTIPTQHPTKKSKPTPVPTAVPTEDPTLAPTLDEIDKALADNIPANHTANATPPEPTPEAASSDILKRVESILPGTPVPTPTPTEIYITLSPTPTAAPEDTSPDILKKVTSVLPFTPAPTAEPTPEPTPQPTQAVATSASTEDNALKLKAFATLAREKRLFGSDKADEGDGDKSWGDKEGYGDDDAMFSDAFSVLGFITQSMARPLRHRLMAHHTLTYPDPDCSQGNVESGAFTIHQPHLRAGCRRHSYFRSGWWNGEP